ncbi:MAG: hypothetical protein V7637_2125 [Mycobacteriales bacterium]
MRAVDGGGDGPIAVLLPGSGSSADFVLRAFGAALDGAGYRLVAPAPRPGAEVAAAALSDLDAAARSHPDALVGGISLGAHLAARWAAGVASPDANAAGAGGDGADGTGRPRMAGLVLALPAWTGAPGSVAAASAMAAAGVERHGAAAALRVAAAAGGPRWVIDELAASWPGYGADLAATLRATAVTPGPTAAQLSRIEVPVGLVGFRDDPMHPAAVAEEWAALLPRCAVEWLRLADLADDRSLLGAAAVRAWRRAAS